MKHKLKRLLLMFLMVITVTSSAGGLIQANALTVEGSSSGSGDGGKTTSGGYAVHASSDDCVGYRFTIVNAAGEVMYNGSIDIYRSSSTYGSTAYESYRLFSTKCKSEWISCYSSLSSYDSVDTIPKNTSNSYLDSSLSITLPDPDNITSYLKIDTNTSTILKKMGLELSNIGSGCMLIVEPLYSVSLKSQYYVMTVTDMGVYGYLVYDKSTTAPVGLSYTDGTYSYVMRYTNNIYPNLLYTENGYGLWSNATELDYKNDKNYTRATYLELITSGYGVCIAYGDNTYTITFHSNSPNGTSRITTMTVTYGSTWSTESRTNLGFSQEDGYTWAMKWNTSADGTGDEYGSGTSQE